MLRGEPNSGAERLTLIEGKVVPSIDERPTMTNQRLRHEPL